MMINQQAKINSILESVKKGELVPATYPKCVVKQDKEYEEYLSWSLLEWGQLVPVYISFDGLDTDNPTPYVVSGDVDLKVINELRQKDELNFEPNVLYRELSESHTAEGFFAAANFIKREYTALQKGMYGAAYLYAGMRERARVNQSANAKTNAHIDTCKEVGKAVGCCDKVVRLAYRLLTEDTWFFDYVFKDRNGMTTVEAKEFILLADPINKAKVLSVMKEMYAAECEAAQKTADATEPEKAEVEEIKEEDMFRREFKKVNVKSLYRRAKDRIYGDDPKTIEKRTKKKVAAAYGGNLPTKEQVQAEIASQEAHGTDGQPEEYVDSYGNGSKRILVDFELPERLAAVIVRACEQFGIDALIMTGAKKSTKIGREPESVDVEVAA